MISTFAVIENGQVKNTIAVDLDTWTPPAEYVNVTGIRCGKGWAANEDGTFTEPPFVEPVQEYETKMQSSEFVNQFTGPEADLFNESTDPVMVKIRNRFILRDRIVDVEDAETIGFMAAAVTAGVLTQERADELSLGKPI
jgi:hypothetical protein